MMVEDRQTETEQRQMAAVYANKFTVETNDMSRIVFMDERAPARSGTMPSSTAAEVVMTHANFIALANYMSKIAEELARKDAK
jgi:hypothetical protein